jgi:polysaccharide export outer membrane protein
MMRHLIALAVASMCVGSSLVWAQQPKAPQPAAKATPAAGVATPEDYVIGPEDVLVVTFWRDDTMSGETLVRPDGKITLRLLGDVPAGGLTTQQLGEVLLKAATKYLEDATVTVVVKQINSRRVTVVGEVARQGEFKLNGPMTVLQVIGQAGGVTEYADKSNISVIRTVNGVPKALPFDYDAIMRGKKLEQDIPLKPGDRVVVPE